VYTNEAQISRRTGEPVREIRGKVRKDKSEEKGKDVQVRVRERVETGASDATARFKSVHGQLPNQLVDFSMLLQLRSSEGVRMGEGERSWRSTAPRHHCHFVCHSIVAVPRQGCPSKSDAGDAHNELPPRALAVDASREDTVLGIMHREDWCDCTIHEIYVSTERMYDNAALSDSGPSVVRREVRCRRALKHE
jgi:hypothetical protein